MRYLQIGGDWWNRCNDGWLNIDQAFEGEGMRERQLATDDKGAHNMVLRIGAETVLPFADESVHLVYAEHVLEHMLPGRGGLRLLHEAYRVLVPGGVLRIATPDLALYMCGYTKPQAADLQEQNFLHKHAQRFEPMERIAGHRTPWSVVGRENRPPSDASVVNNIFRNYGHQASFGPPPATLRSSDQSRAQYKVRKFQTDIVPPARTHSGSTTSTSSDYWPRALEYHPRRSAAATVWGEGCRRRLSEPSSGRGSHSMRRSHAGWTKRCGRLVAKGGRLVVVARQRRARV